MLRGLLLIPMVALAASPDLHVERRAVAGGAELLTVFERLPEANPSDGASADAAAASDVPLVSVLRDTLGDQDPENDRLRYVWVLTSADPSPLQRAFGALPFFYWRPGFEGNAHGRPSPVIDLGDASRGIWGALAGSMTQVVAFDPQGALIRSSTRSYRNNTLDHRQLRLLEGLAVLSQLEDRPEIKALLSEPELIQMEARLTLARQTFGGLVAPRNLTDAYFKQRTRTEEMRGHNWELLRQRAEANGLFFEPLGLNGSSTHALLWIAKDELRDHAWDPQFLGIADPYRDSRLKNWSGYTQTRYFDADGRPADAGDPDARRTELIPLALYALEYPKVPLLLADFRNAQLPKRREMLRHASTDLVSGVLGISKWGNWPFFAGVWTFDFVTARHGAANNRSARLKAYTQVREWMALDHSIDPELRTQLQKRLEVLAVNPLQGDVFDQARTARSQYEALLRYADSPSGLIARLEKDRNTEAVVYEHGLPARIGFRAATIASLGIYSHHEGNPATLRARVDAERRVEQRLQFLETLARNHPQEGVAWDRDEVKRALDDTVAGRVSSHSTQVLERILKQTGDDETHPRVERTLGTSDAAAGE
jgi:hypothetical protein